jgi:hypothetical protein
MPSSMYVPFDKIVNDPDLAPLVDSPSVSEDKFTAAIWFAELVCSGRCGWVKIYRCKGVLLYVLRSLARPI